MAKKHATIEQLDGNISFDEGSTIDEKYENTEHYWRRGWLGIVFRTFLDANEVINSSNLDEESKAKEKKSFRSKNNCVWRKL